MADRVKIVALFFSVYHHIVISNSLEKHRDSDVYCLAQTFSPRCNLPNQVVVITHGMYGRMTRNRCVTTEFGYLGCEADVSDDLHNECSGRYTCDIYVPSPFMAEKNNCNNDLTAHLNVTYKCVTVAAEPCRVCRQGLNHAARLTSEEGYISSAVTSDSKYPGCGTHSCPWNIEVRPGQQIKLTLHDFGYGSMDMSYNLPHSCYRYAMIREESAARDIPICAGHERKGHIHTSVSNSITIQLEELDTAAFLLHYEAVGCADITPPKYANLKRTGNMLEIECEASKAGWKLECVGREWSGEFGECPPGIMGSRIKPTSAPVSHLPVGVLIAIVVAIALVIGSLILTIGIVCLKRYHARSPSGQYYYRTPHDYDYPLEMVGAGPGELYIAPKQTHRAPEPSKYQPVIPKNQGRINCYQIKHQNVQSRPLPSLPNIAEASASASTISRSDDDAQTLQTAAEVHCNMAERRYLTNPRPSGSRPHPVSSTSAGVVSGSRSNRPTSRDDPQYFLLEHNRRNEDRESKSDDPAFHRMRAVRLAQLQAINNNKQTVSPAKPEIAPKPNVKLDLTKATCSGGGDTSFGAVTSSGQKSPEEENAENIDKEVNFNSSCHEIPLRPSRFTAHNVNNTRTENTTGKTSWP